LKTFPVVVAYGQYHCTGCGSALLFEPIGYRYMATAEFATAKCAGWPDCKLKGVKLRIPLQRIECEVIEPPGEDWP